MSRIKICGLMREEDVLLAAELGVDLVGFVFAASPRQVTAERAAQLRTLLPPDRIRAGGVFAGAPAGEIRAIAAAARLELVQLHGDETVETAATVGLPYLRALRIREGRIPAIDDAGRPEAYLLDAFDPERLGGTGRILPWDDLAGATLPRPFYLAGGLTPENVAEAIRINRPDGVDVSSGVEERPGIKCGEKIRRFVAAARAAFAGEETR